MIRTMTRLIVCTTIFAFAGMLFGGQLPASFAQQDSGSVISGKYADHFAGIEIDLPSGWTGSKVLDHFIIVSPTGFDASKSAPEAVMAIIVLDRFDSREKILSADFADIPSQTLESDKCQRDLTTYEKVAGTTVFHVIQQCEDSQGYYSESQAYGILTLTRFVVIVYAATNDSAYDKYESEFEKSIKTLHVDEPVNFRTGLINLTGANKVFSDKLTVKGNDLEIKIESSSKISNFNFDEQEKRVSFRVDGADGTQGALMFPLQNILVGPYTVTLDGKPIDNFSVIEDKETGERILQLTYHHSAHDIVITGTTAIPEFSIALIIVLGAALCIVGVVGRTKLLFPTK